MATATATGAYEAPRHPLLKPRRKDTSSKESFSIPYSTKHVQHAKLKKKLGELRGEPLPNAELRSPNSWFRQSRRAQTTHWAEEEDTVPYLESPKRRNVHWGDDEGTTFTIPRKETPQKKELFYPDPMLEKLETQDATQKDKRAEKQRQQHENAVNAAIDDQGLSRLERLFWISLLALVAYLVINWIWPESKPPITTPADPLGVMTYETYVQSAVDNFIGVTHDFAGVAHYQGNIVSKMNAEVQYIVANLASFNEFWLKSGLEPDFREAKKLEFDNETTQGRRLANMAREIELKTQAHIGLLLRQKYANDPQAVERFTSKTLAAWREVQGYGFLKKQLAGMSFTWPLPWTKNDVISRWFNEWDVYLSERHKAAEETRELAVQIAGMAHELKPEFQAFKDRLKYVHGRCWWACEKAPRRLGHSKERIVSECRDKVDHMLKSSLHVRWDQLPTLVDDVFHSLLRMQTVQDNFAGYFNTLSMRSDDLRDGFKSLNSAKTVNNFKIFLESFAVSANIILPDNPESVAILSNPLGAVHYADVFNTMMSHVRVSADGKPSSFLTILNDEKQTTQAAKALQLWAEDVAKSQSPAVQNLDFSEALQQATIMRKKSEDLTSAALQLHVHFVLWVNQTDSNARQMEVHMRETPEGRISGRFAKSTVEAALYNFYEEIRVLLDSNSKFDQNLDAASEKVLREADELLMATAQYVWTLESSTRHAQNVCGLVQRTLNDPAVGACLSPPKFNADDVFREVPKVKRIVEELKVARSPLARHQSRTKQVMREWGGVEQRNGKLISKEPMKERVQRAHAEAVSIIKGLETVRNA